MLGPEKQAYFSSIQKTEQENYDMDKQYQREPLALVLSGVLSKDQYIQIVVFANHVEAAPNPDA